MRADQFRLQVGHHQGPYRAPETFLEEAAEQWLKDAQRAGVVVLQSTVGYGVDKDGQQVGGWLVDGAEVMYLLRVDEANEYMYAHFTGPARRLP
jgi:hypothetical protein